MPIDRREFLIAGALQGAAAFAAEDVVLEDDSTRLVLRSGRIVSMLDKQRSLEHVPANADASSGLLRVQLIDGVRPAGEIDSTAMTSRVSARTGSAVEIEFEHARVSARVGVALGDAPGEIVWTVAVQPKEERMAVGMAHFPVVVTAQQAAGKEKGYLFPSFEGRLNPLSRPPLFRPHPANLFAQMIACLGGGGGFLLWTDDGEGNQKAFGFDRRQGNAAFAVRHLMPYEPGARWEAPYRTRVSLCGEAWQDAADIYRDWVNAQAWSGAAFRDRDDMPELLRHPPLCISTQVDKENLDTLPARLAAWSKRVGAPIVYRPLGWEKHGNWVGIDYFPPSIGEEPLRQLNARLRAEGIAVAGFISGFYWTRKQDGAAGARNNDALARFFEEQGGAQAGERTRAGELLATLAEGRHAVRVCRGTSPGQGLLQQVARGLFDRGMTIIHDDQDHGPNPGGIDSCFDPSHGHPVPCGPWTTSITRAAFREIRAEAARRELRDFFLTKESCTDLFNMYLHGYQARNFHESSTPGVVPLAQYLFHDRLPTIFGLVTAQSGSLWEMAAMLVYGQVPSIAFWHAAAAAPEAVPAGALTLLSDYYAAMQAYARDYLLYGRMLRPFLQGVPAVSKEVAAARNRTSPRVEISVPQVIQSAWRGSDGSVGVFAVNMLRQETALRLPPPDSGRWRAGFYTGDVKTAEQTVARGETLEWRLLPSRLAGVVFQPAG